MRRVLLLATAALALACGNSDCKQACDKLASCDLKSSGFVCVSDCGSPYDDCAACVNDKPCEQVLVGGCASLCSGVKFEKGK